VTALACTFKGFYFPHPLTAQLSIFSGGFETVCVTVVLSWCWSSTKSHSIYGLNDRSNNNKEVALLWGVHASWGATFEMNMNRDEQIALSTPLVCMSSNQIKSHLDMWKVWMSCGATRWISTKQLANVTEQGAMHFQTFCKLDLCYQYCHDPHSRNQCWNVTMYKYFVTLLKYIFHVS